MTMCWMTIYLLPSAILAHWALSKLVWKHTSNSTYTSCHWPPIHCLMTLGTNQRNICDWLIDLAAVERVIKVKCFVAIWLFVLLGVHSNVLLSVCLQGNMLRWQTIQRMMAVLMLYFLYSYSRNSNCSQTLQEFVNISQRCSSSSDDCIICLFQKTQHALHFLLFQK